MKVKLIEAFGFVFFDIFCFFVEQYTCKQFFSKGSVLKIGEGDSQ